MPIGDCPVCPHNIRDHDVTGCVGAEICACAVPGSELELAARRAGRVLKPSELAADLVIEDADVPVTTRKAAKKRPDSPDTPADTADTPADTAETVAESAEEGPVEAEPDHAAAVQELVPAAGQADPAAREGRGDVNFRGEPIALRPERVGKRGRIYDWPAIKRRYVEGHPASDGTGDTEWPSLDSVAAHFGLHPKQIRQKSATEGWVGARQKWQAQMESVRQQARSAALAKSALQIDTGASDASKLGLQLCMAVLTDRARVVQSQRADNAGSAGNRVTISSLELSRLAQAVDLYHRIGLRAVGDTSVTRLEVTGAGGRPIEIAAELKRDDPQRLAGVLAVLTAAGLGDLFGGVDPRGAIEAHPGDDGVYTTEPSGR